MFRHARYFDKNEGKHNLFGEWDNVRDDEENFSTAPESHETIKKVETEEEEE
jgi:hypothetical protein